MTDDRNPPPWQNERATGARKLQARPDLESPDIIHTGDPDDEPRTPYGLTEPTSDRDDATRRHDGKSMPKGDVAPAIEAGEAPLPRPR